MELNKIYNERCESFIDRIDNSFLNMIITSPPYNVDLGNNKYNKNPYNLYNDNKEHSEYIIWLKNIFNKLYFKLIDGGRVAINIGDGKNGGVPTHSNIIQFMVEIGYFPMTTIIWNKNHVAGRTAWGSYASPSSPSFPTPFEYILVFAKKSKTLLHKGESDILPDEFVKWSLAMWNFTPEHKQKNIGHPAPFPEELPHRLMKMFTYINDIIYDPFMGSGTTALVADKLNRRYIGSEISKEYCEIAENRIKKLHKYDNINKFI